MCGFFAAYGIANDERIEKILNRRLSFRGPDSQSGIIHHKGWLLYHARLGILSNNPTCNQPIYGPDDSVLLFNGEILNFESLCKQHFGICETKSDSVALAKLLSLERFDLASIDGFFAFVRISATGRLVHAVRDPFGVKPLYQYHRGNIRIFSSEASAISDVMDLGFNEKALKEYSIFRAPIFSGSYFQDVKAVEPGTCLCKGEFFNAREEMIRSKEITDLPEKNYLAKRIRAAVESRMLSDFPVGVLLSGGIDSNLIRAYAPENTQFLTGAIEGENNDYDISYSLNQKDIQITPVIVSKTDFLSRWAELVKLRKEPLSVPNEVILSYLGEKWSNMGGKVLLSGEGADEFFGGYDRIYRWATTVKRIEPTEFLKRYAYNGNTIIPECIIEKISIFFNETHELSTFNQVRLFFVKFHLPILFRRLDFSLMYGGIEGREPLASKEIFRTAITFGSRLCIDKSNGKIPLRKLAGDIYSSKFAFEKKVGFPVDVRKLAEKSVANSHNDLNNYWFQKNLELLRCA